METIYRIHRTKDQWLSRSGEIWATWTIFNPNGPTLNCIGSIDSGEPGVAEVFHRWLNPFREEAYGLGRIDETSEEQYAADLAGVLRNAALLGPPRGPDDVGLFSCVPSLVTLPAQEHERAIFEWVFQRALERRDDDWGKEIAYLERFGTQLFARASTDIRALVEQMEAPRKQGVEVNEEEIKFLRQAHRDVLSSAAEPPAYQPRPFSEAAFSRWITKVSSHEFLRSTLCELAIAWVGSATEYGDPAACLGSWKKWGDPLPIAISFEDLRDFLAHYKHPLWPDIWTSELVRSHAL